MIRILFPLSAVAIAFMVITPYLQSILAGLAVLP